MDGMNTQNTNLKQNAKHDEFFLNHQATFSNVPTQQLFSCTTPIKSNVTLILMEMKTQSFSRGVTVLARRQRAPTFTSPPSGIHPLGAPDFHL